MSKEIKKILNKIRLRRYMVAYGGSGIINYRIDTTKKTKFDVILRRCGPNRVNVIRLIKELTGLGLIESKELIDNAPKSIKEGIDKKTANKIKSVLIKAGADIDIQ